MDYDSDYETKAGAGTVVTDVDPYSGPSFLNPSLVCGIHGTVQAYFFPKIGGKK
jgi:hypothetical protein